MRNKKFFCNECQKIFDNPIFFEEKHGLNSPPYERISVCPVCRSDNFLKFDTMIEKAEVAEKLLPAVMRFNRYINSLKDVFGTDTRNIDLDDGVEMVVELIGEMFCFIDASTQRSIFEMSSENDVNKILMYLKGGL